MVTREDLKGPGDWGGRFKSSSPGHWGVPVGGLDGEGLSDEKFAVIELGGTQHKVVGGDVIVR